MLSDKMIRFYELQEQALDAFQSECLDLRKSLIAERYPGAYAPYEVLSKDPDIRAIEHIIPMVHSIRNVFSGVVEKGEPAEPEQKAELSSRLRGASNDLCRAMEYMYFETRDASPRLRQTFQKHGTFIQGHMMEAAMVGVMAGWNKIYEDLGHDPDAPTTWSWEDVVESLKGKVDPGTYAYYRAQLPLLNKAFPPEGRTPDPDGPESTTRPKQKPGEAPRELPSFMRVIK